MAADTAARERGSSLGNYGERRLVAELLEDRYRDTASFGDDSAVIPALPSWPYELVATTDPCPEPLVASLGWDDFYYHGWLLGTINFSDLAAAGAEPLGLLVSYLLPEGLAVDDFIRIMDGVDACARRHGTQVIGGNLGDGPSVQLTGTAIGACDAGKRLSRKGASAGDALLLVGSPGYLWSAALVRQGYAKMMPAADTVPVFKRALEPVAQVAAGRLLSQTGLARAAIDVSDGLYPSVQALCHANGLGAVIDADADILDDLPREICAMAGVDPFAMTQLWGDWTLLVATREQDAEQAIESLRAVDVACHRIGWLQSAGGTQLSRAGQLSPWRGKDAERFTGSSWGRSKLSDYIAELVQART